MKKELASEAPELASRLRTKDPDEAVSIKHRLRMAGVFVVVVEGKPEARITLPTHQVRAWCA